MENTELKQIANAINLLKQIEREGEVNFRDIHSFLKMFKTIYDYEKEKQPYRINIIDELHPDENAYSRIFAKLLSFNVNNKFPFLELFLKEVCQFNVTLEKPEIRKVDSCGRIDIPIFDKKFVVIIENKVTDKAPDQNNENGGQLARYIENIHFNYGRKFEDIFVIYTPRYKRLPSDECWINDSGHSYKDEFKDRFCSLSYRENLYPWIKNEIMPIISNKDVLLRSAVEQYIDHLEDILSFGTKNEQLNMKLQDFIKKEFGLQDDKPQMAIEILSEKETELNNALEQIKQLKGRYQHLEAFNNWKKLLERDFKLDIVEEKYNSNSHVINISVSFLINNQRFVALIESCDCNNSEVYFGIRQHPESKVLYSDLPKKLTKLLEEHELHNPENDWYGWREISRDEVYDKFNSLIKDILSII